MNQDNLIPKEWDLPASLRNRLGDGVGRQRAMFAEDHLLLLLHDPPEPDEPARHMQLFLRRPKGGWTSSTAAPGHAALEAHLGEYEQKLHSLDVKESKASSAKDYFELLRNLNPLVRASRNMRDALQQARELVRSDKILINVRDRAYNIERQVAQLASDVKNSLDYAIARRSEDQVEASKQMAVSAHRLNKLAAFFFPIATLTAIFGMNVKTGIDAPSIDSYIPFALILLVGITAGTLLMAFIMRSEE